MALTRAQLLSGNSSNGVVLPGQPQGVIAGAGITISNTGIISVDSSSVTGLVKLNNLFGYNSYVWPGADGAAGEFLQTDGAGNLGWSTPQGLAVVTVQPQPSPVPADVGELWFDCTTGTLNVYQNCVGSPSPNWFNVAQPGLPVLPGSTSAVPVFTGGSGTQASPYLCTATTVSSGSSVFIVNTVTVTGLAPYQYVPIVDLNAVTNLGRFSFSNYYANAGGTLTFQIIFKDLPASGSGVSYTAAIRVGYASSYIDATVNVTLPLSLSGGSITGTPTSGVAVAFTPPVASGGSTPYSYAYQWYADGAIIPLATSATFTPTTAEVGKTLSVTTTVTDNVGATASLTTTASSQTAGTPISNWAATGSMNTIPGGLSGVYTGAGTNITVTGCIESAVFTPPAVPSYSTAAKAITSGQTLAIRWSTSLACGGAASGTPISGTVTDGIGTNSYNVTVNRVPTPAIGDITSTNVALNGTVSKGIATPIAGLTTTAYVTYVGTSTGGTIGASLAPGGPFTPLATSGTGFSIDNTQTLYIQQTAGNTVNTSPGYTAVIRVGDGTNTAGTYDEFTYFAQTVSTAVFPNYNPTPAGGPNASPAATNFTDTGTLGLLEGTATGTWGDAGPAVTGTNLLLSIGVGSTAFTTSVSPVNGNTVNFCWEPTYIDGLADQATATGSFTNGTYTNTYSFTVEKNPVYTSIPSDSSSFGPNDPITIPQATPDNFNCPVKLYYTPGTNTLSNVQVDINGGGVQPLPSSLATALTLNPGESVEFFADMGPTVGLQYSITIRMGAFSGVWAETCVAAPAVAQPAIDGPNGTTLNPALNSPGGLTLTTPASGAGSFIPSGPAGTNHASSNWEVYKDGYPLTSTNKITGVAPGAGSWTPVVPPAGTSMQVFNYNGYTYCLSDNGRIYRSTDLSTWTDYRAGFYTTGYAVRGQSGQVMYGTGDGGGGNTGIAYSIDGGVTWGYYSNVNALTRVNFASNGSNINVIGGYSTLGQSPLIYSLNGGAWTDVPNTNIPGGYTAQLGGLSYPSLAYGNGVFVATTSQTSGGIVAGSILTSADGVNWSRPLNLGTAASLFSPVYLGGNNWAVGSYNNASSVIYISTDNAVTWSTVSPAGWTSGVVLTGGNGVLLAKPGGGPTDWQVSTDMGSTWSTITSPPPAALYNGDGNYFATNGAISFDAALGTTVLTIAGCQTDGFLVGDTVISGSGAAAGPATIVSLDNSQVTVAPPSTSWVGNNTQTLQRDPASYTQIVPPPANPNTTNLTNLFLAQSSLAVSSKYYARVAFTSGTDPGGTGVVVTSPYSTWHSFGTASSFAIPPGTPMGGGYFAGQINDGGIYNIIVAPVKGDVTGPNPAGSLFGEYTIPGLAWKNGNTGETGGNIPLAQNEAYGKPWTDQAGTTGNYVAGTYPIFQWCVGNSVGPNAGASTAGTGIGGFNDWYIPSKNELEICYYFLKPTTTSNSTTSGSNANAVSPEPVSTNYTFLSPGQTSADGNGGTANFRSGGTQAFDAVSARYWSSTEVTANPTAAWAPLFGDGSQQATGKTSALYARAIRRIPA